MEPIDHLEHLRRLSHHLFEPEIYVQIVEELPDALLVINDRLIVVIYNKQAAFLFQYHVSEVIGQPLNMLVPELQRDAHETHLRRWFEEPQARPMGSSGLNLGGQRKDGAVFGITISIVPIVSQSGVYGMAVVRRA